MVKRDFDRWSNAQVHASLGALHRAIDRAASESLHDRPAGRHLDAGRGRRDSGSAPAPAQEGPAAPPPDARLGGLAPPAPAAAGLARARVVAAVLVAAGPGRVEPVFGPALVSRAGSAELGPGALSAASRGPGAASGDEFW